MRRRPYDERIGPLEHVGLARRGGEQTAGSGQRWGEGSQKWPAAYAVGTLASNDRVLSATDLTRTSAPAATAPSAMALASCSVWFVSVEYTTTIFGGAVADARPARAPTIAAAAKTSSKPPQTPGVLPDRLIPMAPPFVLCAYAVAVDPGALDGQHRLGERAAPVAAPPGVDAHCKCDSRRGSILALSPVSHQNQSESRGKAKHEIAGTVADYHRPDTDAERIYKTIEASRGCRQGRYRPTPARGARHRAPAPGRGS